MQAAPAPPSARAQQQRTLLTNLPKGLLGFDRSNIFILIITVFFSFFQTLLRRFRPGTVLEINGLQVNLVISSTPYCLCMREGPYGFNFVCWKNVFVPCLFCC